MKVSRAVVCSFFESATALQPRIRVCTFFETGVAGTACRGGVAVTGCTVAVGSARAICNESAIAALTVSSAPGKGPFRNSDVRRIYIFKQ